MRRVRWPWPGARATIERSGLFDPDFYRAANDVAPISREDALDHFLRTGAARGLQPHPMFDSAAYLAQTGDAAARANPLLHYLRRGWRAGLRPDTDFDPLFYARTNPDVRLGGYEPLTHYAARGHRELRESEAGAAVRSVPAEPTAEDWAALPDHSAGRDDPIDVIMPVFAGRAETLRAIYQVLAATNAQPWELVVVDDASPDAELVARLADLARAGRITLLTHSVNRGFVAAVNSGMALHPSRDVILLNADTAVFGDWIDRLSRTADHAPSIGTVTPWSSDATILSYPIRLRSNEMPLELSDQALDRLAARLPCAPTEIPTAVGFCMFIKRACLAAVGPFDEERFGRGYGEENDFCCRALRLGWTHVAAPTVFVRHYGARSFGAEKAERVKTALAKLDRLHPDYRRRVNRFMREDPLREPRQLLDEARIRAAAPTHVLTDARAGAEDDGAADVVRVAPAAFPHDGLIDLRSDRVPVSPNLPPLDPAGPPASWVRRLSALNIGAVRTTGREPRLTEFLEAASRSCNIPLERAERA